MPTLLFIKGRTPWNKGKKFSYSPHPKMLGHIPWNKNKTEIFSEETIKKMSNSKKGKRISIRTEFKKGCIPWAKGKKFSEEHRDKLSKANIGRMPWNKGKFGYKTVPCSEDKKKKIRIANIGRKRSKEIKEKMSKISKERWLNSEYQKRMADIHKNRIRKPHSSQAKENMREAHLGSKGEGWKGGITLLRELLRNSSKSKLWRDEVFKRDNYTCQECFQIGGKIHPHHKKYFSEILKEFLQQYNQFSPIEDKETLLRLSFSYESFWDIDNGQTLCKDCHFKKHFKTGDINVTSP